MKARRFLKIENERHIDFEKITLRLQATGRGGGIEIDLRTLGWPDVKMTAYQNYLGGGLLGAICNDCSIRDWRTVPALVQIAGKLAKYFHSLTNHEGIEYEETTFEQNQNRPVSAY